MSYFQRAWFKVRFQQDNYEISAYLAPQDNFVFSYIIAERDGYAYRIIVHKPHEDYVAMTPFEKKSVFDDQWAKFSGTLEGFDLPAFLKHLNEESVKNRVASEFRDYVYYLEGLYVDYIYTL